jgi:hypothetical protein
MNDPGFLLGIIVGLAIVVVFQHFQMMFMRGQIDAHRATLVAHQRLLEMVGHKLGLH